MDEDDYLAAIDEFDASNNYSDASEKCNDCRYYYANQLIDEEHYCEAWEELESIRDYLDASELIELCKRNSLQNPTIGYKVWFDDASWIVLDIEDGQAFLLREEGLEDRRRYNSTWTDVTWSTCSLRSWLNSTYYNSISSEYRNMIVSTNLSNPNNSTYGTEGGVATQDYVFLLSISEFNNYVNGSIYISCHRENVTGGASWTWWLRSPGCFQNSAAIVDNYLSSAGSNVDRDNCVVRPALWINLES